MTYYVPLTLQHYDLVRDPGGSDADYALRRSLFERDWVSAKALAILESLPSEPPQPGDEMPDDPT